MSTLSVLGEVSGERARQDKKWGEQNHSHGTGSWVRKHQSRVQREMTDRRHSCGQGTWLDILEEEFKEVAAADEVSDLREELVQVAAVAVAWVEAIDRQ